MSLENYFSRAGDWLGHSPAPADRWCFRHEGTSSRKETVSGLSYSFFLPCGWVSSPQCHRSSSPNRSWLVNMTGWGTPLHQRSRLPRRCCSTLQPESTASPRSRAPTVSGRKQPGAAVQVYFSQLCVFCSCRCILCFVENTPGVLKVALHFFVQYHINDQ